MKRPIKLSFYTLALSFVLLTPQSGNPCGPEFPEAVFTFQNHPDAPLEVYARGNLGVLLPSFARSYLVVAFRHLSGRPLATSETEGALRGWLRKLKGSWGDSGKAPIEEWAKARDAIFGAKDEPPSLAAFREDLAQYSAGGTPCQPDSFHTAVLTLKDRARRFGVRSVELREWTHGQDVVFSDCNRGKNIPAMVSTQSPALLQADRKYQIAAAHFYTGDYATAVSDFDQIGQDKSSPWRTMAPYLAARAHVRTKAPFAETQARLRAILRDRSRSSIHPAVRKLLGYVAYRVDPEKRTHELGRLLASSSVDPNFEQDLIDYTFGLDGTLGESPDFSEQEDTPAKVHTKETKWYQQRFREIRAFALADEMTDWILTFQLSGDAGWTHAIQRWQKQRTLPWLVAAISIINADDKVAPELLLAAEQVPSSSPAYPTISYHRVRLLMQAGKGEQARALLNELLPSLQDKVSASSYNLFLAQRAKLVTSFQDFLIYASRPSVGEDSWGDEVGDDWLDCGWRDPCEKLVFGKTIRKPLEPRFDTETALILNTRMPLDLLGQAALGHELAKKLRGELAVAAWTRAVMLGRHDIASTMAPEAAKAYPVMKDDLESYISAGTAQDKWHAALFTILGYPGARPYVNALSARSTPMQKIDNYSDNWWCEDLGSNPGEVNYVKDADSEVRLKQRRDAPGYPAFLSAEQVSAAKSEWKALSASGSANGYLSQQALKWAKEAPDDPRIPEVLHDAVRATRFACGRKSTSDVSREAFRLLHSRYPHSRWAKETPYWY